MADNLIFPVKFDLEAAVRRAQGDADKYLRQLENTLRQKPIKLDVAIDGAAPGSIDAISKRMAALSTEFNKLTEAQRVYTRASGEFTPEAQKIIKEYAELTAATQTYAQSLSQITAAAKRQTQEQMKAQEQEIKRYEEYWKRKEAENAKQAQQEVANAERARKAQQQRISQEQAADAKRYQEWLRQKNQEAVETESVERQKQQSRERTIAQQNREFAAQRQAEQQRQQAISASLRAEYQRIEAKKQAEAASRRELQMLNQQYAAEERRQRLAASQASIAKRQQVIKTLRAEENTIVNITAKLQHWQQVMNSSAMDGRQFKRAAEEVQRLSQKLSEAQARISQLTSTTSNASTRQSAAVRQVSQEFGKQDSYLTNLLKKTVALWSIHQVGSFLTNIKEVTAQFELQRVSLGAIIQDQNRANQLFSEIKSFALKSPVKILDLTKYTKQLAAYKVGWDGVKTDTKELFDWTKKLTDVSVGLGVSMDRVVLAFGQVRATGYLRASEVRQFTEMGVPIVEELAAKLSEMNGEMVTSAQVMDMISKRGISFEMVKDVFNDMTSAGGIFYNMQEKQGNTLYGMWAKLGDAASVMYDQIGNTESINNGMKAAIQALTDMMRNWKDTARYISYAGIAIAGLVVRNKILKIEMTKVVAIQQAYNTRLLQANALTASNSRFVRAQGVAMIFYAKVLRFASTMAAAFGTSLRAIKSALISTGWGALIVALGYVADKLFLTKTNAEKAAEAISKISEETATETAKSVRNFEYLANKAVGAAKGSTEQKEALEELERTYRNILPKELLELEYLDKLNGKYGSLTKTIREYIAEQQRRKTIDEIENVYGAEKQKYERSATEKFRGWGWTEGEIARFWEKFYYVAKDKSKTLKDAVRESLVFAGRDAEEDFKTIFRELPEKKELAIYERGSSGAKWGKKKFGGDAWNVDDVDMLRDAILEENQAIEQYEERAKAAESATNAFAEEQEKAAKKLKELRIFGPKGELIDRDSYLGGQALANFEIKNMTNILKDGFARAGLAWDEEYGNFINHIKEKTPELISSLNFDAIIDAIIKALDNDQLTETQRNFLENLLSVAQQSKKRYEEIVPADPIVRVAQYRFKQLAQSAGGFREQYNQYLMKSGEDFESYNKRLKDELEKLKNRVKALLYEQKLILKVGVFTGKFGKAIAEELQKDLDETNQTITIIERALSEQPNFEKSKGRQSDPRLQNLKEEISLTKKLYDEYHKLEKQIGATKAAEKIQEIYSNTIKTLQDRAGKYGFKFEMPFTDENLESNMQHFIDKMKELQKLRDKKGKPLFPNIGKEIDEAVAQLEDVDLNSLQKALEKKLKQLSDRISRTKTAKEFYEKILGMTGDYDLATKVADSIFGQNGDMLQKALADQVRSMTNGLELPEGIISPDNIINYKRLGEFAEQMKKQLGEEPYKAIKKIAEEGQKDLAKTYEGYLKDLEKAKTYADKRVELARTTAEKIREIDANVRAKNLTYEEGKRLKQKYSERETIEDAKYQFDEYKESELYLKIFSDLDKASTTSLQLMKKRLEMFRSMYGNMYDPTQLKELQEQSEKIEEQLSKRNPFKALRTSFKKYKDEISKYNKTGVLRGVGAASRNLYDANEMYGEGSIQAYNAEVDLKAAKQLYELHKKMTDETGKQLKGRSAINSLMKLADSNMLNKYAELEEAITNEYLARDRMEAAPNNEAAKEEYNNARKVTEEKKTQYEAAKKLHKQIVLSGEAEEKFRKIIEGAVGEIIKGVKAASDLAGLVATMAETFGGSEEDVQFFKDIQDGLNSLSDGATNAVKAYAQFASGDIFGGISSAASAIGGIVSGVSSIFSVGKVKKANKEIKRQQQILEQLEYTYSRLEAKADKLFGREYINNFKKQQENLEAQARAYKAQADAERSKGKKADEGKIKEYENAYRETMDKIADMQGKLAEQMTGSDIASSARDFANAWLEAYASFGNTAGAIKDKFKDMIKNMVVESVLAQTVQRSLQPMFDKIDEMYKQGASMTSVLAYAFEESNRRAEEINNALTVAAHRAEQAGVKLRGLTGSSSDFSGISRDIASASEESINGLAAGVNTQNYYMSYTPRIYDEVAALRAMLEKSYLGSAMSYSGGIDYTDIINISNQHLSSLPSIEANTAQTVKELQEVIGILRRVTIPKGGSAAYGVNVYMRN